LEVVFRDTAQVEERQGQQVHAAVVTASERIIVGRRVNSVSRDTKVLAAVISGDNPSLALGASCPASWQGIIGMILEIVPIRDVGDYEGRILDREFVGRPLELIRISSSGAQYSPDIHFRVIVCEGGLVRTGNIWEFLSHVEEFVRVIRSYGQI